MFIKTFRKKPVIIQAVQFDGTNADFIAEWAGRPPILSAHAGEVIVQTLEGQMKADVGDWIIRGVKGEFYPCKPDIFDTTYEQVSHTEARYVSYDDECR